MRHQWLSPTWTIPLSDKDEDMKMDHPASCGESLRFDLSVEAKKVRSRINKIQPRLVAMCLNIYTFSSKISGYSKSPEIPTIITF